VKIIYLNKKTIKRSDFRYKIDFKSTLFMERKRRKEFPFLHMFGERVKEFGN